jgi:hypothetical protein
VLQYFSSPTATRDTPKRVTFSDIWTLVTIWCKHFSGLYADFKFKGRGYEHVQCKSVSDINSDMLTDFKCCFRVLVANKTRKKSGGKEIDAGGNFEPLSL